MQQKPLFYDNVVPLNKETHKDLKLKPPGPEYGFAQQANLIPALVDEFGAAMAHIPVAFLPASPQPAAVFVTGLEPGSNLYLDTDGKWEGGYIPAYLRRYPFIIGDVADGDPILCVDESFSGFSRSKGTALFSKSGEPEPIVNQALSLALNYRTAAKRSDEFCATVNRMGLFRSVTLEAKTPEGKSTVVHGLFVIDEAGFDALGEAELRELHSKKFIKPIFEHLASLSALNRLSEKAQPAKPNGKAK